MTFPLMPLGGGHRLPFEIKTPAIGVANVAGGGNLIVTMTTPANKHRYLIVAQGQTSGSHSGALVQPTIAGATIVSSGDAWNTGGDDYQAVTLRIFRVPTGTTATVHVNDASSVNMIVMEMQGWYDADVSDTYVIGSSGSGTLTGLTGDALILYVARAYFNVSNPNSGLFEVWQTLGLNFVFGAVLHHPDPTFSVNGPGGQGAWLMLGYNP